MPIKKDAVDVPQQAFSFEISTLNRQRKETPDNPEVAHRWCMLALQLGQPGKVLPYAARLYREATDPMLRIQWARLVGMANFRLLKLEDTASAFSVCIALLIEQAEAGFIPPSIPIPSFNNQFASGEAELLLWETSAKLAELDLPAFPISGTLLGLERDGRLLPFDKDIDLAIWTPHFSACCSSLNLLGWQPISNQLPFETFKGFKHLESGITLDVYGIVRDSNNHRQRMGYTLNEYPSEYQSIRSFRWQDLILKDSPAGKVWYLNHPHDFLEDLYGDWRIPNPWWDSTISSKCIDKYTLLVRCFGYDRLLKRWISGQMSRAWGFAYQIALQDPSDRLILRALSILAIIAEKIRPGSIGWPPPIH